MYNQINNIIGSYPAVFFKKKLIAAIFLRRQVEMWRLGPFLPPRHLGKVVRLGQAMP
jgi:hypothetical protein